MNIIDDLISYKRDEDNSLMRILNSHGFYSPSEIRVTHYFNYFKTYFGEENGLGVTHFFFEEGYISRDYILDYSQYYSLCYHQYEKKCSRVHLFIDYGKENFHESLENNLMPIIESDDNREALEKNQKFWNKHYLGFLVLKPIPQSTIGFSLLRTYNYHKDHLRHDLHRYFWATRKYMVHIYGKEVEIDSIAFQQQDTVLSACATVSIWVMLHRASLDPIIPLKSPGAITIEAGITSLHGNRLIPNKNGLSIPAMCEAITKNNLLTEVRIRKQEEDEEYFEVYVRKLVYAYSSLHLPIILGADVIADGEYDGHAVAICGHRLNEDITDIGDPDNVIKHGCKYKSLIYWKALQVDQLYVHDDQVGPFSRMEFTKDGEFLSFWDEAEDDGSSTIPIALIMTVFPKVRISYDDVENLVLGINEIIVAYLENEIKDNGIWSIQLRYSEEFKREVISSEVFDFEDEYDQAVIKSLRKRDLPKYIWIASYLIGDYKVIDFMFDATDYYEGYIGMGTINYYPELCRALGILVAWNFVRHPELLVDLDKPISYRYCEHFSNSLRENNGFIWRHN